MSVLLVSCCNTNQPFLPKQGTFAQMQDMIHMKDEEDDLQKQCPQCGSYYHYIMSKRKRDSESQEETKYRKLDDTRGNCN